MKYVITILLTLSIIISYITGLWFPLSDQSHWSSYFLYAFSHSGVLHLVGNILFISVLGYHIEPNIGKVRYIILIITSIFLSGLTFTLTNPGEVVGASGLGIAMLTLFTLLWPQRNMKMFGVLPIKSIHILVAVLLYDIIMYTQTHDLIGGAAHVTHITGAVTAYFLFQLFKEHANWQVKDAMKKRYEKYIESQPHLKQIHTPD